MISWQNIHVASAYDWTSQNLITKNYFNYLIKKKLLQYECYFKCIRQQNYEWKNIFSGQNVTKIKYFSKILEILTRVLYLYTEGSVISENMGQNFRGEGLGGG